MKNKMLSILIFLSLLGNNHSSADGKLVTWNERTYKTTLPEPFGLIIVTLNEKKKNMGSKNKKNILENIQISYGNIIHAVNKKQLKKIFDLDEPELVVDTKIIQGRDIKEVKILFYFGENIIVPFPEGIDCESDCYHIRKPMIEFIIRNDNLTIVKYDVHGQIINE